MPESELSYRVVSEVSGFGSTTSIESPPAKAPIGIDQKKLTQLLEHEKEREQEKDRVYWEPLKKELEFLRHKKSF